MEVLRKIDCPVIVEGKDDKIRLNQMRIKEIMPLKGKSLFDSTFNISKDHGEVLILMDFDKEGRKLSGKIISFFQSMGVKTNGESGKKL